VNYRMQADELKAVRLAAPELARWSYSAEQQVLRRLDKAFKAFFGRIKLGRSSDDPRTLGTGLPSRPHKTKLPRRVRSGR
jgi:hypothetical protein